MPTEPFTPGPGLRYRLSTVDGYRALQLQGAGVDRDVAEFIVQEGKGLVVDIVDAVTPDDSVPDYPDPGVPPAPPSDEPPPDVQVVGSTSMTASIVGVALIGAIGWMLLS